MAYDMATINHCYLLNGVHFAVLSKMADFILKRILTGINGIEEEQNFIRIL